MTAGADPRLPPANARAVAARPSATRTAATRGSVVVMIVLFLPIFLLLLGLVIDIGVLFVQRQGAYSAADMAVLAGAREIDLDRLARGERYLNPAEAESATRTYFASNLAASLGSEASEATATVRVFNPPPGSPARDPVTGRLLADPTVCLSAVVPARLYFLAFITTSAPLRIHADASLLERKR
ncbi:MAG TPA: pilus assembly protein TadG-related protein [Bacillota bacterium]|jgi:uncharacterized membrane protein